MEKISNSYSSLIEKLDNFIRKYYKNQIIRGVLFTLIVFIVNYLLVSILEYFGRFSVPVRTTLFYSTLLIYLAVFVQFIFIPFLHFIRIGKIISYPQAAAIIAQHFNDLQDKLLNTLELSQLKEDKTFSHELVLASIEKRIAEIKPIPFNLAINLKENLKYAKYLGIIALIFIVILAFSPSVFTEGSMRIINHQTYFAPEAPFQITLINDTLNVPRGGDFEVKVKISGKYVPNDVSIVYGGNTFLMAPAEKGSISQFSYKFRNVNNSIDIYFTAENISTQKFTIAVLPTPVILDFKLTVDAPAYTNETDKVYDNVGDVTVPAGSKLTWQFETKDIEKFAFLFNDSLLVDAQNNGNEYMLTKTVSKNSTYDISIANKYFSRNRVVSYLINVVPDLYPSIDVINVRDSVQYSLFYYKGNITDDYGFKNLTFNYFTKDNQEKTLSIPVEINKSITTQEYYFMFDFSTMQLNEGDEIDYYFEVWDNDGINGSKASRTQTMAYKVPTMQELQEKDDEMNESIQGKINKSVNLAEKLKNSINKLQMSNIDQNKSTWEKSKMMKEVFDMQKQLEQLMNEVKQEVNDKNQFDNSFKEEQEELLEKQKQIEELMENLMTDELKELLKQIEDLQNEFKEEEFNKVADELKMNYDELSKQLDRNLEMLKKFEIEQKIENTIDRLDKLTEAEEQLSEKTDKKENSTEELKKNQENLKEELNDLKEEYKDALQKNEELEEPMKMEEFNEEFNQIEQQMQESKQNMDNNKRKKAAENQKNAAQKMKELSQKMQNMMQQMEMEAMSENMEDLRQILDNLVQFSFEQESMLNLMKNIHQSDPKLQEVINGQKKLNDDFVIINDSLKALAKRNLQMGNTIDKAVFDIKQNLLATKNLLEMQNPSAVRIKQQQTMTSVNDLALLLSEVLEQMQNMQQMQSSGQQGNKQKKKGNGSKSTIPDLKQAQDGLKKQMEKMLDQMKNGDNANGKMSQNLAKSLAQQEVFQKMLNDLRKNGGISKETDKILQEIDKLVEQTEKEIVNKNITNQTLIRQQQIMQRLLEAEKSENERETEEKRESKEPKNYKISNPENIFKNKESELKFKEDFNINELKFNSFYKNKYKDYLLKLQDK